MIYSIITYYLFLIWVKFVYFFSFDLFEFGQMLIVLDDISCQNKLIKKALGGDFLGRAFYSIKNIQIWIFFIHLIEVGNVHVL